MKHILLLVLLILSSHALATENLLSSQTLLTYTQFLDSHQSIDTSSVTKNSSSYQQSSFNFETISPAFWQSESQHIQFSEIAVINSEQQKINQYAFSQFIDNGDTRLKGVNANYQKDNLSLNFAMLDNQSLAIPQEQIFIQGSLTIWTLDNFNLSLQGRIDVIRNGISTNNIIENSINQSTDAKINKSLSVVGSYVLSDTWAVTGAVMRSNLDEVYKKRISNKKDSDNVALIGTIYSF